MSEVDESRWRVRIVDMSGGVDDDVVEEVRGFISLEHANAFARTYVRDSVERCRSSGMEAADVVEAWYSFGEDARVLADGEEGWHAAQELQDFAEEEATPMQRDWRALDPRRLVEEDETDEE